MLHTVEIYIMYLMIFSLLLGHVNLEPSSFANIKRMESNSAMTETFLENILHVLEVVSVPEISGGALCLLPDESIIRINERQPFWPRIRVWLRAKRRFVCFPGRGGSGGWSRTATDGDSSTPHTAAQRTHVSHVTTMATEENEEMCADGEGLYSYSECESKAGR